MRPIKFRGICVKTGEWVYGYRSECPFTGAPEIIKVSREPRFYCVYEVIPETVGQFTGLCDKNKAEAYEGDVFDCESGRFKIGFEHGSFVRRCIYINVGDEKITNPLDPVYSLWDAEMFDKYCEVIGNIHQPELKENKNE